MFIDYNESDAPADLRADLCIVGAGAAGITLASALAHSGMNVCVIESGGLSLAQEIQSLYDGNSVGMGSASPSACRLRYFGGTTNHWQGWCAPLQEIDFQTRSWVPQSGWPLSRADLDPYYEHARRLCQIGPVEGELASVGPLPRFDPDKFDINFWHFSPPTRFGSVYRESLAKAARVSVVLHCNVYKIETNATATAVRALRVRTLTGEKKGTILADNYILACGGMENTRMLLLTNEVDRAGLANRCGLLGKYFTQHIEAVVGRIASADAAGIAETFGQRSFADGLIRAHPALSAKAQQAGGLLNAGFAINAENNYSAGYKTLMHLRMDLTSARWPGELGSKLWSVVTDLDALAGDLYRRSLGQVESLTLDIKAEQAPNSASTLSLDSSRDAFGLPRLRVDWRLSPLDKRSIAAATQKVAAELGRLKLGRLKLEPWMYTASPSWPDRLWGGCHHMGTTRMSHEASMGIVDPNCRVHGIANLYVAGSSVFPTGGYVPPTLTIVALALRLADYLKSQYASAHSR